MVSCFCDEAIWGTRKKTRKNVSIIEVLNGYAVWVEHRISSVIKQPVWQKLTFLL